jgi:hypothetical protein
VVQGSISKTVRPQPESVVAASATPSVQIPKIPIHRRVCAQKQSIGQTRVSLDDSTRFIFSSLEVSKESLVSKQNKTVKHEKGQKSTVSLYGLNVCKFQHLAQGQLYSKTAKRFDQPAESALNRNPL